MSMIALIGASVFIVVFMMMYYGVAGIFANIAMLVNVLVVVAVMAMFGSNFNFTRDGRTCFTVGMAVDANVIINERIRELLR
ncbi:protein translocase subunit SecD, partial [Campylobacter jejuni]|nr:protein translocase subunit SecD [Campylobacter jejuni]